MALSTRADNILLLLYAPGASGQVNSRISSVARLHHDVFVLQHEGRLWLPRGRSHKYIYVQNEFGLFSADFFDDFFALNAMACLSLDQASDLDSGEESLDLRRYFRDLAGGDQLYKELESLTRCSVALSTPNGVRLGALLFEALEPQDKSYLTSLKTRSVGALSAEPVPPDLRAHPTGRPQEAARRAP
jgi:hypothetical protein